MAGLYDTILDEHRRRVEQALPGYLPGGDGEAPGLHGTLRGTIYEAMRYACAEGGKRLRPVLVMEFCRLCGGQTEAALPFACAIEMIHSYSLVHDDLPCMDDSPLRRGRPSAHAAFGEDMALLAGDALLTRAFEVMLSAENRSFLPPEAALRAACSLADAAGVQGMVGGQVIDLQSEGKDIDLSVLEQLQEGKTAALMIAACEMGCHLAGGSEQMLKAAHCFGEELGLCFQIVDDILDVTATAEELGKPVGGDEAHQKATYVSLLGREKAERLARERTAAAIRALEPFGREGESLRALAQALLHRAC